MTSKNTSVHNFVHSGTLTRTLVTAALLASTHSFAQKGLDFGLRANIQASSLINNSDGAAGPELDYKINTGVAFGVGADYNLNKHIGVGVDLLYSKQGQGYKGSVGAINPSGEVPDLSQTFRDIAAYDSISFSGSYTARRDVTYLKIPIMFRFTGNNMHRIYFSTFIGPQIDLLTAASYKINGQDASFAGSGIEAKDTYKKMTLDVAFGVGLGVRITDNINASLHLRLDYGLTDMENKNAGTAGSNFYPSGRATTQNATGGGFISVNYKLVKKEKPEGKSGAAPRAKR